MPPPPSTLSPTYEEAPMSAGACQAATTDTPISAFGIQSSRLTDANIRAERLVDLSDWARRLNRLQQADRFRCSRGSLSTLSVFAAGLALISAPRSMRCRREGGGIVWRRSLRFVATSQAGVRAPVETTPWNRIPRRRGRPTAWSRSRETLGSTRLRRVCASGCAASSRSCWNRN